MNNGKMACAYYSKLKCKLLLIVYILLNLQGGTHVGYIVDQMVSKMMTAVKKKASKELNIKPFQIKNHLWVFVNCLIENPSFDSQTKENMTLSQKSFGSTCELSEKFIKSVRFEFQFSFSYIAKLKVISLCWDSQ